MGKAITYLLCTIISVITLFAISLPTLFYYWLWKFVLQPVGFWQKALMILIYMCCLFPIQIWLLVIGIAIVITIWSNILDNF